MEDLLETFGQIENCKNKLSKMEKEFEQNLRHILWGSRNSNAFTDVTQATASPQQTKKRAKRLSSLCEDDDESNSGDVVQSGKHAFGKKSSLTKNNQLLVGDNSKKDVSVPVKRNNSTKSISENDCSQHLMPPPPVPTSSATTVVVAPVISADSGLDMSLGRPSRAAKLKPINSYKEKKVNEKMRRPTNEQVNIKLEHEQRKSQMLHTSTHSHSQKSEKSLSGINESVLILRDKSPAVVHILSEDESNENDQNEQNQSKKSLDKSKEKLFDKCQTLRIRLKREKVSILNNSAENQQQDMISEGNVDVEGTTKISPEIIIQNSTDVLPIKETVKNETQAATPLIDIETTASDVVPTKRGRKKKQTIPKPIKIEPLDDNEKEPEKRSTRSRKDNQNNSLLAKETTAQDTLNCNTAIGENAEDTDTPPTRRSKIPPKIAAAVGLLNETVTVSSVASNTTMVIGVAPKDATFCANSQEDTFVVPSLNSNAVALHNNINETFDISPPDTNMQNSLSSSKESMKTARDTITNENEYIMTEDESFENSKAVKVVLPKSKLPLSAKKVLTKLPTSAQAYKMPNRANELFNPLMQSPVKLRVEAFENAAQAATLAATKSTRAKRTTKATATPTLATTSSSSITPQIGKIFSQPSAPGRFLTPTQTSNAIPTIGVKKTPNSASKVLPFPKGNTASNYKSTGSSSAKALSRENSSDDVRKGIHQLAEERKKQREQKHFLAAQQREAKERERAERLEKVAKEREEKRFKKQMEADQKKRALDEINRKLREQEESEANKLKAMKAKAAMEKERELLMQMKQKPKTPMHPPPPKLATKYTFEMLHEDDSTDDEDKVTYKRPPPPSWSRRHERGIPISRQQYWPTNIIDSFFSVQPMTPDLKKIFPDIDARYLKRNSSVLWSTPPRYSELPKY